MFRLGRSHCLFRFGRPFLVKRDLVWRKKCLFAGGVVDPDPPGIPPFHLVSGDRLEFPVAFLKLATHLFPLGPDHGFSLRHLVCTERQIVRFRVMGGQTLGFEASIGVNSNDRFDRQPGLRIGASVDFLSGLRVRRAFRLGQKLVSTVVNDWLAINPRHVRASGPHRAGFRASAQRDACIGHLHGFVGLRMGHECRAPEFDRFALWSRLEHRRTVRMPHDVLAPRLNVRLGLDSRGSGGPDIAHPFRFRSGGGLLLLAFGFELLPLCLPFLFRHRGLLLASRPFVGNHLVLDPPLAFACLPRVSGFCHAK